MTTKTVDRVSNPHECALYASIVISGDYGIPNTVREIPNGYVVEWEGGEATFLSNET